MALSPVELCLGFVPGDEVGLVVEALGSDGAVLATGTWTASSGAPLCGVLDEFLGALDAVAHTVRVIPASGLVAVGTAGEPVHPVLVGPSTATEPDAGWLTGRLPGGVGDWVAAVGSAPSSAWMLAKLSWLHRSDTAAWEAMAAALTPAAWLVRSLTGRAVTTESDAAATGCWNAGGWRYDLLAVVDGARDWTEALPAVADPDVAAVGAWRSAAVVVG